MASHSDIVVIPDSPEDTAWPKFDDICGEALPSNVSGGVIDNDKATLKKDFIYKDLPKIKDQLRKSSSRAVLVSEFIYKDVPSLVSPSLTALKRHSAKIDQILQSCSDVTTESQAANSKKREKLLKEFKHHLGISDAKPETTGNRVSTIGYSSLESVKYSPPSTTLAGETDNCLELRSDLPKCQSKNLKDSISTDSKHKKLIPEVPYTSESKANELLVDIDTLSDFPLDFFTDSMDVDADDLSSSPSMVSVTAQNYNKPNNEGSTLSKVTQHECKLPPLLHPDSSKQFYLDRRKDSFCMVNNAGHELTSEHKNKPIASICPMCQMQFPSSMPAKEKELHISNCVSFEEMMDSGDELF